jgi:hypothetical protein
MCIIKSNPKGINKISYRKMLPIDIQENLQELDEAINEAKHLLAMEIPFQISEYVRKEHEMIRAKYNETILHHIPKS